MLKFVVLIIALLSCSTLEYKTITGETMGTTYHVTYVNLSNIEVQKIKSDIDSILYKIDKIEMSTWTNKSVLGQFNASSNTSFQTIPKSLYHVIESAQKISNLSKGAFDVTVMPLVNLWGFGWKGRPKSEISEDTLNLIKAYIGYDKIELNNSQLRKKNEKVMIDLSAIAKGYAVDVVSDYLNSCGIMSYLVEIGGEVRGKGKNSKQENWTIGINKPSLDMNESNDFQEIISFTDWGIATSGDYRNYYKKGGKLLSHTINPVTFSPVEHELGSVTVISRDCMTADALATTCMVLGVEKALGLINSLPNTEAMFIERLSEGKFRESYTDGFKQFIKKVK